MEIELVKRLRRGLLDDDNVLLAYVFGSRVKAGAWRGSDVDVAVLLRDSSWSSVSKLMDEIAEALNVSVGRVDLIDLSEADDVLRYQVLSEGHKVIDRGLYESKVLEELYTRMPDAAMLLSSYIDDSANPLRREVVALKLMVLDEEARILERYVLSKPVAQVIADPLIKRVLRDSLRVAIESVIDACKHVVASMRLGVVRDYKDFPLKMAEAGLMGRELAGRIADAAKLRNVIVHRYTELNYPLLYEKADELVRSIAPTFRRQLMELLRSTER
ncbi:TPA: DUF86 domain-containing protein [Candidatus Bathyarchaeota archaeon]|nr:DUF86 domain-containing protein [Candidatus Bathyarchaeota archaeon]